MTDKAQKSERPARGRPWLWLFISLAGVVLDQFSKWLSSTYLKPVGSVKIIPGFLNFTYIENRGAAFGSFSEQRWVFMIFSVIAIVAVTVYLLRFSENHQLLRWSLALIISGGVGNMFDRVGLGYVVDFIDFHAIWQYIFNIADCFVCIGAGLMVLYCILTMRDEIKQEKEAKTTVDVQAEEDDHEC
jgi:signal peptidase II